MFAKLAAVKAFNVPLVSSGVVVTGVTGVVGVVSAFLLHDASSTTPVNPVSKDNFILFFIKNRC